MSTRGCKDNRGRAGCPKKGRKLQTAFEGEKARGGGHLQLQLSGDSPLEGKELSISKGCPFSTAHIFLISTGCFIFFNLVM